MDGLQAERGLAGCVEVLDARCGFAADGFVAAGAELDDSSVAAFGHLAGVDSGLGRPDSARILVWEQASPLPNP